jgi:hypothetical protein
MLISTYEVHFVVVAMNNDRVGLPNGDVYHYWCWRLSFPNKMTLVISHGSFLNFYLLALTSPTNGGRSVGIVRSRTKAMEFSLV